MRQVEITEPVLRDGTHTYHQGDVKSLDEEKAAQWIAWGWAKCVKTGDTGTRMPGVQKIKPDSIVQAPTLPAV